MTATRFRFDAVRGEDAGRALDSFATAWRAVRHLMSSWEEWEKKATAGPADVHDPRDKKKKFVKAFADADPLGTQTTLNLVSWLTSREELTAAAQAYVETASRKDSQLPALVALLRVAAATGGMPDWKVAREEATKMRGQLEVVAVQLRIPSYRQNMMDRVRHMLPNMAAGVLAQLRSLQKRMAGGVSTACCTAVPPEEHAVLRDLSALLTVHLRYLLARNPAQMDAVNATLGALRDVCGQDPGGEDEPADGADHFEEYDPADVANHGDPSSSGSGGGASSSSGDTDSSESADDVECVDVGDGHVRVSGKEVLEVLGTLREQHARFVRDSEEQMADMKQRLRVAEDVARASKRAAQEAAREAADARAAASAAEQIAAEADRRAAAAEASAAAVAKNGARARGSKETEARALEVEARVREVEARVREVEARAGADGVREALVEARSARREASEAVADARAANAAVTAVADGVREALAEARSARREAEDAKGAASEASGAAGTAGARATNAVTETRLARSELSSAIAQAGKALAVAESVEAALGDAAFADLRASVDRLRREMAWLLPQFQQQFCSQWNCLMAQWGMQQAAPLFPGAAKTEDGPSPASQPRPGSQPKPASQPARPAPVPALPPPPPPARP